MTDAGIEIQRLILAQDPHPCLSRWAQMTCGPINPTGVFARVSVETLDTYSVFFRKDATTDPMVVLSKRSS